MTTTKLCALRAVFFSMFEQHDDRIGQSFTLLGALDPLTYDYDDVGPMYRIRFDDGVEIDAWPEEVFDDMLAHGGAR